MAETKTQTLEREYIIPLRAEWRKVANYRRTGKAVKAIKKFIARHMKIQDRDLDKVKLDTYLNQEVWFRGRKKPPAKIKVRAIRDGEFVRVELAEMPEAIKFAKLKHEKMHKPGEKTKVEEKKEEPKPEGKTEEEKKEESEKEEAVAQVREADAKQQAKAQKHTTAVKDPGFHRMALKK